MALVGVQNQRLMIIVAHYKYADYTFPNIPR